MSTIITIILLFFIELLIIPTITLGFEPPKVLISETLIGLLLIVQLWKAGIPAFKNVDQHFLLPLIGLFLLTLSQLVFNLNLASLFGNTFRLQGIFLLWLLMAFSCTSSSIIIKANSRYFILLSLSLLFIFTYLIGNNPAGRAIGTLGEPNALAATAIFIFPFIYYLFKNLSVKVIGFILCFIILLLAKSDSGFLALLVETIFIFLTSELKISLTKGVIISLIFILATLSLPFLADTSFFSRLLNKPISTYEDRALIWKTAFVTGNHFPVAGLGFGNIQISLNQTAKSLNNTLQYVSVDSSHNFLLDYWVQGGILGVLFILFLLLFAFINLIKQNQDLKLTVFLGIVVVMLFNPVSIGTLIAFWFLLGQGSRSKNINQTQH